jgi:hypothetical protein
LFYSVTISFNLLGILLTVTPIPSVIPSMFSMPNFALANAMACVVFRGLHLGSLSDDYEDTSKLTTLRFVMESPPVSKDYVHKGFPDKVHSIETLHHRPPIAIEITQMTECQYDDGRDLSENESHRSDEVDA